MKTYLQHLIVLLCVVVGLYSMCPAYVAGQESGSSLPVKKQGGPIVITGDNLKIDSDKKIATYTGNVKVVQGETSMFSDLLVIHLDQTGGKLEKAIATGNVRLINDTITATGEEGTFYNQEQKLELIDDAKVWQDNNTITAHRIIAFLTEEVLEGYADDNPERVVMTVYSTAGPIQTPFGESTPEAEATPEEENSSSESASSEASSEEETTSQEESVTPIVIVSDTLKFDNKAQKAMFTGDVIATKDVTELQSEEMFVYLTQTPEASGEETANDIEKIEVFGEVTIIHETTTITGEEGLFLNQEQYAKVTGGKRKKARAEDTIQNLILEAPVIEIYLETNTINASKEDSEEVAGEEKEPGSQRIRTTFGTDDNASLFEQSSEETEQKPAQTTTFTISDQTLENLQKENVSEEIVEDLEPLKNQEFTDREEFLKEIEELIGLENTTEHKSLLLKHSISRERGNNKDLPSVTIYPQK